MQLVLIKRSRVTSARDLGELVVSDDAFLQIFPAHQQPQGRRPVLPVAWIEHGGRSVLLRVRISRRLQGNDSRAPKPIMRFLDALDDDKIEVTQAAGVCTMDVVSVEGDYDREERRTVRKLLRKVGVLNAHTTLNIPYGNELIKIRVRNCKPQAGFVKHTTAYKFVDEDTDEGSDESDLD